MALNGQGMDDTTTSKTSKTSISPPESLLCLKCRAAGHIVSNCPSPNWLPELGFPFSVARRGMEFHPTDPSLSSTLCSRCRDLKLPHFLSRDIPWTSRRELNQVQNAAAAGCFRSLGKTGSIEFRSDCALCRCLFALTPNAGSEVQDVVIFPNWSILRLEGGVAIDNEAKKRYAKCLLVVLHPSKVGLPLADCAQRGDALCMVEEDEEDDAVDVPCLSGRDIQADDFGENVISMIDEWVSACASLHPLNCQPVWDESLREIRLIDVETREIVIYPPSRCEYIALSYVWGDVGSQSYPLGPISPSLTLPNTVEDAITMVKKLGKRYLWVDSLCIDQENEAEKLDQIKRMSSIYRGAHLTIIALSGESANAGLPRMRPDRRMIPQLQCQIDGKRFVGLMPTLSQLVWVSPWGSRAWTLQEAILSPRCLYVADYQMYFECNAMQCSESLNDKRSWVHQTCRNSPMERTEWSEASVGAGVLRRPLVGYSEIKNNPLIEYGSALSLYCNRKMTKPADALNAFSGILQDLRKEYDCPFFEGLPVPEFQWGLLWRSQVPPQRRAGFPTWSWAGWEGPLWQIYPADLARPHQWQPYLRIWRAVDGRLVPVFGCPASCEEPPPNADIAPSGNDDWTAHVEMGAEFQKSSVFQTNEYPIAEKFRLLFMEAIVLHFIPDYSENDGNVRAAGVNADFRFTIRDVTCWIEIMSVDLEVLKWDQTADPKSKQSFLLVARDHQGVWVHHHLLLLEIQAATEEWCLATRTTALNLRIPEDRCDVIAELNPVKRRVILG